MFHHWKRCSIVAETHVSPTIKINISYPCRSKSSLPCLPKKSFNCPTQLWTAVWLSRPYLCGHARIYEHLWKIARITPELLSCLVTLGLRFWQKFCHRDINKGIHILSSYLYSHSSMVLEMVDWNVQVNNLQSIIFNQYFTFDDSQHCGAISNIWFNLVLIGVLHTHIKRQYWDLYNKIVIRIENVTNRVVVVG